MAKEKDDLTTDDKFMLLLEALTSRKEEGISRETLTEILAQNSSAVQKGFDPNNKTYPGHSAMSYPEGDLARPREAILTKDFFYLNFPVRKFPEAHWYRELELAEQIVPGDYTVLRKDGSLMAVTVKGEYNAKQELTKVSVMFPVSRDEKWLLPPMFVVLYQLATPGSMRKNFMAAMNEYMVQTLGAEESVPA